MHHVHTNVYEKDPDLNHGFLRVNSQVPHTKLHYFQVPIYLFLFYPFMLYNFNAQNLGVVDKFRKKYFPEGNKGYAVLDESLRVVESGGNETYITGGKRIWANNVLFSLCLLY